MLKKLLITNLILYMTLSPVLAVDKIGNEVNEQEFPQSEEVLPKATPFVPPAGSRQFHR